MEFTTYEALSEQVERRLGKITEDSDLLRPEIMLALRQRVAVKVFQRFWQTKNDDLIDIDGGLIHAFKNIPVLKDDSDDLYYSTLPSSYVALLYGGGIKQVSPTKDHKTVYVPVKNGFSGLYKDLEGGDLEGQIGYYPEQDKIYYENMTGANNPPTVTIKLTAPVNLPYNTKVNISSEMQAEVIEEVVAMYAPKPPQDNSNNANDQA